MSPLLLEKYAQLLAHYCLEIKPGDRVFVDTTTLAEPLLREFYSACLKAGAHVECYMSFEDQRQIYLEHCRPEMLAYVSPVRTMLFESYDAYLHIRAPFASKPSQTADILEKELIANKATKPINDLYFSRIADGSLRRSLCQFPTLQAADQANMTLQAYEHFVASACKLMDEDPIEAWQSLGRRQQKIADFLNTCNTIRYLGPHCDISFSCQGRIWINSDGKTNMPSGEVYTAPVDDSTNGWIRFSYPAIFRGSELHNVTLQVRDGLIQSWSADNDQAILDQVFSMEGTRRFGEAAIGTNYDIPQITKNILFDEKIGGSVHMAIGQAYKQNNGTNSSPIHWDMITDMKEGGQIYADGKLIYENGYFLESFL